MLSKYAKSSAKYAEMNKSTVKNEILTKASLGCCCKTVQKDQRGKIHSGRHNQGDLMKDKQFKLMLKVVFKLFLPEPSVRNTFHIIVQCTYSYV